MATAREFFDAAYRGNEAFVSDALKSDLSLALATSDPSHYEKESSALHLAALAQLPQLRLMTSLGASARAVFGQKSSLHRVHF